MSNAEKFDEIQAQINALELAVRMILVQLCGVAGSENAATILRSLKTSAKHNIFVPDDFDENNPEHQRLVGAAHKVTSAKMTLLADTVAEILRNAQPRFRDLKV